MDDTVDASVLQMELHRVFAHPRERVFDAWSRPEAMKAWMGPSEAVSAGQVSMDFREGGSYRIAFIEAGEPDKWVAGTYLDIRRPERLVFTWTWSEPFPDAGVETTVVVDFTEVAEGTLVHLRHLRFSTQLACDMHAVGWAGTLDKLARRLHDGLC